MLTEIDIFLIGVLGGAVASIALAAVFYSHFHVVFKDYFYNKDLFLMSANIKKLRAEMLVIQEQIKQMNADTYHSIVEDEYR